MQYPISTSPSQQKIIDLISTYHLPGQGLYANQYILENMNRTFQQSQGNFFTPSKLHEQPQQSHQEQQNSYLTPQQSHQQARQPNQQSHMQARQQNQNSYPQQQQPTSDGMKQKKGEVKRLGTPQQKDFFTIDSENFPLVQSKIVNTVKELTSSFASFSLVRTENLNSLVIVTPQKGNESQPITNSATYLAQHKPSFYKNYKQGILKDGIHLNNFYSGNNLYTEEFIDNNNPSNYLRVTYMDGNLISVSSQKHKDILESLKEQEQ